MKFIISRAHDVRQALPLDSGKYVCLKCGMEGRVEDLFKGKRCTPTIYKASSGWQDESTTEEREWLDRHE